MRKLLFVLATAQLITGGILAQQIPLTNWTVPPYRAAGASGGLSTMTDVTPGIAFVGVTPCRLVDTTNAGFPATYGPPALIANTPRSFDLNSDPQCPGIPAGVDAYSLNITAAGTQGSGFIVIYPQGGSIPVVSTLNYVGGQTVANAAIVPAAASGGVTVIAGTSGTHLVLDINGYFTDAYNPGVSFHAVSGTAAPAILGENTSASPFAIAVFGHATATAAVETAGVWGATESSGGTLGAWGVLGLAANTNGRTYGVWGETKSVDLGAAGVFGVDGSGPTAGFSAFAPSGVRGESRPGYGVLGVTENNAGVRGVRVNPVTGNALVEGVLGTGTNGVLSIGDAHVAGTFTATTNKGFVQPHPFDPSKEIRYISLEGPHTEVYFRGTAQVSRGVTRIAVPEDFHFVADAATYSTLVTAVGDMATVAVLSEGPNGIVVRASRDVKVHYVVYAEREAVRNPDPIIENVHFRPEPDRDFLAHVPDTFRRLMVQNGTLNPDGTVNMETARRLGWDKEWEKRRLPVPQPTHE